MQRVCPRRLASSVALLLAVALVLPATAAPTCFPETAACIDDRFSHYWEQNGGLAVFGFATTAAREESNRDLRRSFLTQWFERNRLELHPENRAPYDVLLGRLGDDRLRQLGRDWRQEPAEAGPQSGCLWFEQTRHNVCDQPGGGGFKSYWQKHGLEFDGIAGVSRDESLALWGLPLTAPRMETNTSGDTVLTQWFERARFEWHPQNEPRYQVLLGLLGSETHRAAAPVLAPAPSPAPSPAPGAVVEDLPEQLVALVNQLHVEAGCTPFRRDERLDTAAQGHASDIAAHRRIDHRGTDGSTLRERLSRVGYPYSRASEGIAVYQSPEQVVAMWMDEPPDGPHRRNITDCAYVDLGVGVAVDERGRRWWVMDVASQRVAG